VVNFDQIRPGNMPQSFLRFRGSEGIMAMNAKRKEYARYAAHCLQMVTAAKEQESRSIQREMAAEWLKLASAAGPPQNPNKCGETPGRLAWRLLLCRRSPRLAPPFLAAAAAHREALSFAEKARH